MSDNPKRVSKIVAQIAPLLDGYPIELQGVVLADLMAPMTVNPNLVALSVIHEGREAV